jgi:hypothetical protein
MLTDYVSKKDGNEYSAKSSLAFEVESVLLTRQTYAVADRFMICGNHILIKEPRCRKTKNITASDHGYEGDYSVTDKDDEFFIYDKFIVTESGCDYTLPPSYDLIAFNRFTVHQTEGTSCTFRDWRGTVVFDGASLGTGRYDVHVRLADGAYVDYYDNRNQVWEIYKNGELVDTMPHVVE